MASIEKTGLAEKDGTSPAAKAPKTNVRRSKRLQEQNSRITKTSSEAKSGIKIVKKLPLDVSKKGRKAKNASNTTSKPTSRPTKRITKSKISVDDSGTQPDNERPAKIHGENNAISEAKSSPKPTLEKQPAQLSADRSKSKSASQTSRSRRSPSEDIHGQRGDHPPSPKRKLDQSKAQHATNSEPPAKSPRLSSYSHNRTGNPRTFGTLQKLASAESQIKQHLPRNVCCTDTVDISRLPSPLADVGDQRDRFLHFIDKHVPDQVRLLFHQMRNDSQYFQREIARAFVREAQGVFVEFLSSTQSTPGGGSDQDKEDDGKDDAIKTTMHCWPRDAPKFEVGLGPNGKEASILLQGTKLEACVFDNAKSGQRGHYMVNDYDRLIINESVFGQNIVAGPLPEFAIIQIDRYILFWWRTIRALNYTPQSDTLELIQQGQEGCSKKQQSSPPVEGQQEQYICSKVQQSSPPVQHQQGQEICSKEQQSFPPEEDWADVLDRGLARHRGHRQRSGPFKKGKEPHQIDRYWDLDIDNVLLAIASIWDGLRRRGVIYAFAGVDVFDPEVVKFGELSGEGIVGGPRNFLIPLLIPPNSSAQRSTLKYWNKNKGKAQNSKDGAAGPAVGHIVLAVAERLSDESNIVTINILDSRIGTVQSKIIDYKAATLATRFGWSGYPRSQYSARPFNEWPRDELPRIRRQLVPQQPAASNACGLFTILYAWAVMLEVPLINRQRRHGRRSNEEFMELGQELVNLALAGFMDSRTIQAFFNVFGFSDQQDAANQEHDVRMRVDAVRMNHEKFQAELSLQRHRDADIPMPSLTPEPEGGTEQTHEFPEEDIRLVRSSGGIEATEEQALRALRQTNGNLEDAVAIIQAENRTPEPPNNE